MSVNKISDFSRVNQRLLQAKFLLQQTRQLSQDLLPPLHQDAMINAVLMHFELALIFYLREIASSSRLKMAYQISSIDQLQTEMAAQSSHSQSVDELVELKANRSSWLSLLLGAIRNLSSSTPPQPEAKAFSNNENQIPLVQIEDEPEIDVDQLEIFLREIMLLIQRQRLVLAEF